MFACGLFASALACAWFLRGVPALDTMAAELDVVALTKAYFEAWNSHSVEAIQSLHADKSSLHDWDATHGPTAADVAKGIAGIWKSVPAIKVEVVTIYTCGADLSAVANIKVVVDATTTLDVCDVIEFDRHGKVVSINAFLASA